MPSLVAQSIRRLRDVGVRLDPGLSDAEVAGVERKCGFTFGPEHREFLQLKMPVGRGWPDWRNDPPEELRRRLNSPIDGVLFDVHSNGFWPASWGHRPEDFAARDNTARVHLGRAPLLVPLFSHRYLTADSSYSPSPVFSVHQADVIVYGVDLLDYVAHEFLVAPLNTTRASTHVPFWSDLSKGAEDSEL